MDKNNKTVKHINLYLGHIINKLRNDQNFVFKMLWMDMKNAEKEILSSIVTHSLYENMFSSSLIEDEYLFLIYRSLKKEISNLQIIQKPDLFLSNSINAYLLKNLSQKDVIQSYFKSIIEEVLEKMEIGDGNKYLIFSIDKINYIIEEQEGNSKGNALTSSNTANLGEASKPTIQKTNSYAGNTPVPPRYSNLSTSSSASPEGGRPSGHHGSSGGDLNISTIQELVEAGCVFEQKEGIVEQEKLYHKELTKDALGLAVQASKDIRMKDYLLQKYFLCKKKDTYFSATKVLNKISQTNKKDKVNNYYYQGILQVIEIIKKIVANLKRNLEMVPYSIKFICKIISVLITKKFPQISIFERNAFIAQFFIDKLFKPIFVNPTQNCLLSKVFVSKITSENLGIIQTVLSKLFSGNFFSEKDNANFTTFNLFFIEIMPQLFEIFDALTEVELPSMMQNFLNKELKREGFEATNEEEEKPYDFFEQNPGEIIKHTSVCLCLDEIETVLSMIEKHRGLLLTPYKDDKNFHSACSKIMKVDPGSDDDDDEKDAKAKVFRYYKDKLQEGREMDYKEVIKENNEFIIQQSEAEEDEEEIYEPKDIQYIYYVVLLNDIQFDKGFKARLPEKDEKKKKKENLIQEELSQTEKNIKEFTEYVTVILTNFQKLSKNFFAQCKTPLEVFQKILKMSELDYFKLNDTFFLSWSLTSAVNFLEKRNSGVSKINVDSLLKDLIKKTNDYINKSPLFTFIDLAVGMEYFDKTQSNYDNFIKKFDEIEKYNFVDKFVEEARVNILISINVQQSGERKLVILKKTEEHFKELETFLFNNKKQGGITCKTVQRFIKKFPNIFKPENRHFLQSEEPFKLQVKWDFPTQLKKYAEYLKIFIRNELIVMTSGRKKIKKRRMTSKDKSIEAAKKEEKIANPPLLEEYFEETMNYIYRRIYHKLFPIEPSASDIKIYDICKILKEKNYEKDKYQDCDKFIVEMVEALMDLELQNCPNGKANAIIRCFSSCKKINIYVRGKKDPGMDEFLPMFTYALIQQVPSRMDSNIEFLKLYLDEKHMNNLSFPISIIEAACEFIKKF
ncbi:MAG: hypothetical protein MJ252_15665 [archaeon]|nr:hypothetical protein [archaeon]